MAIPLINFRSYGGGAPAGITLVGTKTLQTRATNGAAVSVTVPSIPDGSVVVALVSCFRYTTTKNVTSTNLTFALRAEGNSDGAALIYTAVRSGATLTNEVVTFTTDNAGFQPTICVYVVAGADTTALTNIYQGASAGTVTAANCGPITPAAAGSLILGLIFGSTNPGTSVTPNADTSTEQFITDDGDGDTEWFVRYPGLTPNTTARTLGGTYAPAEQLMYAAICLRPL